jgi:hypothetical protein
MDESDLREWCKKNNRTYPEWNLLGIACLDNYELSFNYYATGRNGGAANLMELPKSKVYGLLFEINKEYDLETVRKKEGHPNYYEETQVTVTYGDKSISNVKTYKVVKNKEKPDHQRPTKYYMDLILKNACINGFPPEYIQTLKRIETQCDP